VVWATITLKRRPRYQEGGSPPNPRKEAEKSTSGSERSCAAESISSATFEATTNWVHGSRFGNKKSRVRSLCGDGDAVGLEEALRAVEALGRQLVVAKRPQQLAHLQPGRGGVTPLQGTAEERQLQREGVLLRKS
jgi:hypothetical protein